MDENEQKSFNEVMNQMKKDNTIIAKAVQEAGGSMSDAFNFKWNQGLHIRLHINLEMKVDKLKAKVDKIIEVLLKKVIETADGEKVYPFEELNKLLTI